MKVKSFPETRKEPRKRILLIPIILIFGGLALTLVPYMAFIGSVIALTGALTVFLVGMIFADLWAASKRTKDIIKEREKRGIGVDDEPLEEDPFIDVLDEDEE